MRNTFRGVIGSIALACVAPIAAFADEPPPVAADQPVKIEVGLRYWYSMGTSEFDLFSDGTPTTKNSALHYKDQTAHSAEAYFRADHAMGIFVKGVGAIGSIADGALNDEDFPPAVVPYSSTLSEITGDLGYITVDIGYNFIDRQTGDNAFRLGAFVGFNYWYEVFDAKGCSQIATNPGICVPPLAPGLLVITEDNEYTSIRFGLAADVRLSQKLKLAAEVAYLLVDHDNVDTHHFTFGPLPAHGDGTGYQLEALLSYDMYEMSNVGIGARLWQLETDVTIDGSGQLETYDVSRYGVFLQAGVRLN
jgi:outer membrane protease